MFEGYTHLANLLICNFDDPIEKLNLIRDIIENDKEINGGATLTQSKDISIKIFGYSAQKLTYISEEIIRIFEDIC